MASQMDPEIKKVWLRYRDYHRHEDRERLILQYFGLVKYVVKKLFKSVPAAIEEGDLVSIGIIGLVEAMDRFDPEFGIKFETYAIPRIRGVIIDELRSLDWIPRSLRTKSSKMRDAIQELERENQETPSDDMIAEYIGVSYDDIQKWKKEMLSLNILSLDRPVEQSSSNGSGVQNLYEMVEDDRNEFPLDKIENNELKIQLVKAIQNLPEKLRLAITLYYFEKLTFKEIGQILSVSESRISQIHSETIKRLKSQLSELVTM
jgi:RNA polymerase sigma factor for flagellar operon FliA